MLHQGLPYQSSLIHFTLLPYYSKALKILFFFFFFRQSTQLNLLTPKFLKITTFFSPLSNVLIMLTLSRKENTFYRSQWSKILIQSIRELKTKRIMLLSGQKHCTLIIYPACHSFSPLELFTLSNWIGLQHEMFKD